MANVISIVNVLLCDIAPAHIRPPLQLVSRPSTLTVLTGQVRIIVKIAF